MISTAREAKVLVTALSLVLAMGLLATPVMAQAGGSIRLSVNGAVSSVDVAIGDELRIAARNDTHHPVTVFTLASVAVEPGGFDLANAALLRMRDLAPGGKDQVAFALPAGLPITTYALQSFALDIDGRLLKSPVVLVTIAP